VAAREKVVATSAPVATRGVLTSLKRQSNLSKQYILKQRPVMYKITGPIKHKL
jgi:hypothetical protein